MQWFFFALYVLLLVQGSRRTFSSASTLLGWFFIANVALAGFLYFSRYFLFTTLCSILGCVIMTLKPIGKNA